MTTYIACLPNVNRNAISYYTTPIGCKRINNLLRYNDASQNITIKRIMEAFPKINSSSLPKTFYRGLYCAHQIINTYKTTNLLTTRDTIIDDGIISVTTDIKIAKQFIKNNCCILKITLQPNTEYDILDIKECSSRPEEKEYIFKPGTVKFVVTVPKYNDEDNYGIIEVVAEKIETKGGRTFEANHIRRLARQNDTNGRSRHGGGRSATQEACTPKGPSKA
jgi:hypothetical protein